jgi:hypothetical protein
MHRNSDEIVPLSANPRPAGHWSAWLPWAMASSLAFVCMILVMGHVMLRTEMGEKDKQLTYLLQAADSLSKKNEELTQAVADLRETNRLSNMRIAMLNSLLADSPKAVAVSLWDNEQQTGVFVVQNLKPLPADRDYQLWVIDPKYATPVSAGVFQVDAQGNVRLQFKTDKLIQSANKFAVTQEPKGGLPTPTMANMVLIGG